MSEQPPSPPLVIRWRPMPVCLACWQKRYPEREPTRFLGSTEELECFVCEQPAADGIFVRVRIEWR